MLMTKEGKKLERKQNSSREVSVKKINAITMQLILKVAEYLVGVLGTSMEMMRRKDPSFESGAIAFYQNEFGIFACGIASKNLNSKDGVCLYAVVTGTGLLVEIPAFELMTGWESDFPDWSEIDWGYMNWTDNYISGEPIDEYPNSKWNPDEDWEPDDRYYTDLYSDLAENWEKEESQITNSIE